MFFLCGLLLYIHSWSLFGGFFIDSLNFRAQAHLIFYLNFLQDFVSARIKTNVSISVTVMSSGVNKRLLLNLSAYSELCPQANLSAEGEHRALKPAQILALQTKNYRKFSAGGFFSCIGKKSAMNAQVDLNSVLPTV